MRRKNKAWLPRFVSHVLKVLVTLLTLIASIYTLSVNQQFSDSERLVEALTMFNQRGDAGSLSVIKYYHQDGMGLASIVLASLYWTERIKHGPNNPEAAIDILEYCMSNHHPGESISCANILSLGYKYELYGLKKDVRKAEYFKNIKNLSRSKLYQYLSPLRVNNVRRSLSFSNITSTLRNITAHKNSRKEIIDTVAKLQF